MEYLSRMFDRMHSSPKFSFHPKCQKLNLTHLYFANDLMVFCRGDIQDVSTVTSMLTKFGNVSGST